MARTNAQDLNARMDKLEALITAFVQAQSTTHEAPVAEAKKPASRKKNTQKKEVAPKPPKPLSPYGEACKEAYTKASGDLNKAYALLVASWPPAKYYAKAKVLAHLGKNKKA